MANIAYQRLKRELKELTSDEMTATGIKLVPVDDQLTLLRGELCGPPESPYENGTFTLSVEAPETYPFKPPEVRFQTKIWHPNISSQTGVICLDILRDQWAASMSLRTLMLSLRALLCAPEPNDPQDAVVAKQCIDNKDLFQKTAKYWSQTYAKAGGEMQTDFQEKVQTMVEMGASEEAALGALSCTDWDVTRATERIFQ